MVDGAPAHPNYSPPPGYTFVVYGIDWKPIAYTDSLLLAVNIAAAQAKKMREDCEYLVINKESREAFLSKRDMSIEEKTGKPCIARINLHKQGYEVYPEFQS